MKFKIALLTAALMSAGVSQTVPQALASGSLTNIALTDVAGKKHDLLDRKNIATALIFVAHDCPISNAYAPEINRIASQYASKKIGFILVYAESGFNAAAARNHAAQYGYRFPAVLDALHHISTVTGATATPEAVVVSPSGRIMYQGRIDNRYATWGKTRAQTTQHDLREALDEVLAGKPVQHPFTRAIGCYIPDETK